MDSRVLPPSVSSHKAILTRIDVSTRYVRYVLLKQETSAEIYQALFKYWLVIFGPLQTILVDRLRANVSSLAKEFTDHFDIYIRPGLFHRSLSLAVVERSHRTATDFLAKALTDGLKLDQMTLDLLAMAVNGTYHASIGTTPLHAMTGAPQPDIRRLFMTSLPRRGVNADNVTGQLGHILQRTEELRKRVHDHLRHVTDERNTVPSYRGTYHMYPPGSYVYALDKNAPRNGTKLQLRYTLARVVRVVSPNHYRVKLRGAADAISLHRHDLQPCYETIEDPITITLADRRRPVTRVSHDAWWERMDVIQRERTTRCTEYEHPDYDSDEEL